jgi:endonuclease YncB( thermonuclease family)
MVFPAAVVLSGGMLRLLACACMAFALPAAAGERLAGRARVLDGDAIAVGGVHVRLKGVAAPEVPHPGHDGEPGSEAARAFLVELVEGETVVGDLIQERTHGRRVGYCYLDGRDLAAEQISAGLARD